nr:MAG TPA: hypothetical protein [Caudoviricetes sp.]
MIAKFIKRNVFKHLFENALLVFLDCCNACTVKLTCYDFF